ncbi:MAG: hydroxymethylglutaryl-CoA synthase [Candidatus Aenigmarchaeota archaeon]|nr:hydroxymethylglutaryl-CoA synthase [Candidatus Aenigmarchaeota archaeon]
MSVGIVGYGAYVPRFRITSREIARVWGQDPKTMQEGLLIEEKSVPDIDEDTITISIEASKNAFLRAGIRPKEIGAVYIGSESHPYAVKPSGTVVAEALGIGPEVSVVDTEFACRAGTTSMFICCGLVKAGYINYGLAIGADTSQGMPGDALEYSAAAGGAAFIIGGKNVIATIDGWFSFVTDTADFWRRDGQEYPRHAARFTGEPSYFRHVMEACKGLMGKTGLKPSDFSYAVFHTPNGKFPLKAGKSLGFTGEQLKDNLLVSKIGNTYSGASPLVLSCVLDKAKPGEKIMVTSYGSGAGSDSFCLTVTEDIKSKQDKARKTMDYVADREEIDYARYVRLRGKIKQ